MAEYKTDNASRPFCSERCKLLDLGAWAEERYSIPGAAASSDLNRLFAEVDDENPTDASLLSHSPGRRLNS